MALAPGQFLSHYEILGPLGAGGMGEVYRARDTRLKREVAIKVLPPELACASEHRRRFEREARALAALNHPNVAQVFGIDQVDDTCFIAMELVRGEDLAERLVRGPLPPSRAIDVCRQIAAGLEAAHESGVVHRDLKPANVRRTPEGDIKVLDFGLAKPVSADAGGTLSDAFTTQEGRLLGTPTYMAPEQARGAAVDRRVDVWAFGCVLYECLTGRRAFAGETVSDVLVAVLEREADLSVLPPATPPRLRELLERCLRKDPRRRLRDVGDARLELEELLAGCPVPVASPAVERAKRSRTLVLGLPIAVAASAGAFVLSLMGEGAAPAAATKRLSIALPRGVIVDSDTGLAPPIAVSPDGGTVVFAGVDADSVRRLYVRRVDEAEARPLLGTEGAEFPFFSHDGDQIGFAGFGASGLFRVRSDGTVGRILIDGPGIRGVSWGPDDALVVGMFDQGLLWVPVEGGSATPLTTVAEDEFHHRWPQFLPDGKSILYTASTKDGGPDPRILSLETGESTSIGVNGAVAHFLPEGFVVFVRSDELLAVRFDLATQRAIGEPAVVRTGLHSSALGTPYLAVSANGALLVHEPARPPSHGRALVWIDREGRAGTLAVDKGFEFPRISPDGRKIAVAIHQEDNTHSIWSVDAVRGIGQPVTSGGNDLEPTWTPLGDRIAYASVRDTDLHWRGLSAEAEAEVLLEREGQQLPLTWTPEGRLLFHEQTKQRRWDVLELDPADGSVRGLAVGEFNERAGTVSPDGRWLAYVSDETGSMEIYVRSYPDLGPKERITAGGGVEPVWSPRGGELFFRNGRGLYAVFFPPAPGKPIEEPRLLFQGNYVSGFHERPNYDVDADAERFVMVDKGEAVITGRLDVTLDLVSELERLLAE